MPFEPKRTSIGTVSRRTRVDDLDMLVAERLRQRRTFLRMSQEKLGEALGISFQQIQKYERGINRVSASRLFDLSQILDVPIEYFFEKTENLYNNYNIKLLENLPNSHNNLLCNSDINSFFSDDNIIVLIKAYSRIKNSKARKNVLRLIKLLS